MNAPVIKNNICALHELNSPQRQQEWIARTCAHQVHAARP